MATDQPWSRENYDGIIDSPEQWEDANQFLQQVSLRFYQAEDLFADSRAVQRKIQGLSAEIQVAVLGQMNAFGGPRFNTQSPLGNNKWGSVPAKRRQPS